MRLAESAVEIWRLQTGEEKRCVAEETAEQSCLKAEEEECRPVEEEAAKQEKAADVMAQELHDHYRDGYTLQYDVPLNKLMVDYDIQEFIMNYVGGNSWDDLSQEDKRKCYMDYPEKRLPDLDAIEQERY